ncbi:MAG: preprotein translocase subunit SecA [Myxococcota bacterium]
MAWWNAIIPTKNERELKRIEKYVDSVGALEQKYRALPDDALRQKTNELKNRYLEEFARRGGDKDLRVSEGTKDELEAERKKVNAALEPLIPEAFALVREAGWRVMGMRHYDVQIIGGMVLHEGKIAEMKTGEGKTLVATLPVYLNALAGRGVHLVTVNEYLAARDAEWMGQVYGFLGLSVGVIVNSMGQDERKAAYNADITYGTNSEFGFDYLRDNMKLFLQDYVQRGHHFAIVDEVDSILIDEARTPLIISGPAEDSTDKYVRVNGIIPGLKREQDFTIDEKARTVLMTENGISRVEDRLGITNLYDPENIELLHHVNQALKAHTLFRRDVDYMIDEGKIKIIDENTGRVLDGRRWSDGLHQAVEAKEGVKVQNENQTLATITYQNYFRMYMKLGGMTGTAETESEEFAKIYDLDVIVVPTNKPVIRDDKDDLIFRSEREKFEAIAEDIQDAHTRGQPVLVGTTSVEKSEVLSRLLKRLKVPHSVLNAKYHEMEAQIVAQAGAKGSVTIATNMAGRGTDIVLGGNPEALAATEVDPLADPKGYESALVKWKAKCEAEKKEVLEAGGLKVVGSERHESRRIDNQLRGRSGRQGDPGATRFYISFDDDLMRIFGGEKMQGLMERMGMKEGEVIEHRWVNKSVENAQRRVEGHNFDIRKHLLEYDDVMNDQRKAVYKLRRGVLGAEEPQTKELVLDLVEESIINVVSRVAPPKVHPEEWDLDALGDVGKEIYATELKFDGEIDAMTREELEEIVFKQVQAALDQREETYTSEALYHVSRIIYLQTIDQLWKEHLREMDNLREGVGLRSYAQKDPKQEYKKEGYNLFVNMMGTITADVLSKVFRVQITQETEEQYEARLQAQREKQRALMQRQREVQAAASDKVAADKKDLDKAVSRADVSKNKKKRERRRGARAR